MSMAGISAKYQIEEWTGNFGKEYTDRHTYSYEEWDRKLGEELSGTKKSEIFKMMLTPVLNEGMKVLEVGCNIGLQLMILKSVMPPIALHGLEPQQYAIEKGKSIHPEINFVQGTAFNIPYPDNSFDIVMTNRMLIHIQPAELSKALFEIQRVSSHYIFFHEYFSRDVQEIVYRNHRNLLWKMDYKSLYLNIFPNQTIKKELYIYYSYNGCDEKLTDQICLFEK